MIKTKYSFLIFLVLLVLVFPYFIFFLGVDSISSLVPGWNTNIFGGVIINDLFIFCVLSISVYLYWKLFTNKTEIGLKHFLIHFILTIPTIFFSGSDLFEHATIISFDSENFIRNFYLITFSFTLLFFIGQILFWIYYAKITR